MNYFSTRDTERKIAKTSAQAIKQGIAEDGGLFMPETIPALDEKEIKELIELSYNERAAHILSKFLTDYSYDELLSFANAAYSEDKFAGGATDISPSEIHTEFLSSGTALPALSRIWLCR